MTSSKKSGQFSFLTENSIFTVIDDSTDFHLVTPSSEEGSAFQIYRNPREISTTTEANNSTSNVVKSAIQTKGILGSISTSSKPVANEILRYFIISYPDF